ncbi:hypothetical protein P7K49_028952 [Saguinus oedipus]|uniref:Uncharacterized protein n=1 Tax=Saguinus oedipus TaxID=9490 RepID=A0ABQ9U6L7_SAGOE|nr:hypothetical protein P7K49_028952 [Saguinus oedipus]
MVGRGRYGYPPDYYGYEDYYDDYCGYDYHNYCGDYEDPYYIYGDGYAVRGRGGGREGDVLHHHQGGGEHHLQEVELAIHRGGHLWDHQEALGMAEGVLHNSKRGCCSRGSQGNRVGNAMQEARERQMGTTNLIPTTNRTRVPNPSLSSCFSKVVTILVTMVTIMITSNFIRILMGNSGIRQVRA